MSQSTSVEPRAPINSAGRHRPLPLLSCGDYRSARSGTDARILGGERGCFSSSSRGRTAWRSREAITAFGLTKPTKPTGWYDSYICCRPPCPCRTACSAGRAAIARITCTSMTTTAIPTRRSAASGSPTSAGCCGIIPAASSISRTSPTCGATTHQFQHRFDAPRPCSSRTLVSHSRRAGPSAICGERSCWPASCAAWQHHVTFFINSLAHIWGKLPVHR